MAARIEKVILAGDSGQGILFAGRVLARAGLAKGLQVTWVPETGPLGAGTFVVATVILAERRIASPVVSVPDAVVALSAQARERLFPTIKAGGFLVEPAADAPASPGARPGLQVRDDIRRVEVPFEAEARAAEAPSAANLVALGAFGKLSALVGLDVLAAGLEAELGAEHPRRAPGARALEAGERYVAERRYMKDRYALALFSR